MLRPLVIEKFTENVRFCLICNYLTKIIPAIQSRCTRFRFGPLSSEQILPRLNYVIAQEKYAYILLAYHPYSYSIWKCEYLPSYLHITESMRQKTVKTRSLNYLKGICEKYWIFCRAPLPPFHKWLKKQCTLAWAIR